MSKVQKDGSTPALVQAIESNLFEFSLLFRRWPKAEVHDDPDMLWSITDIPFPMFNSVLRAQLNPGRIDEAIVQAIGRCKSRDVPMLWQVGPTTSPTDLGDHLLSHGFTYAGETPGMAIDLQTLNENSSTPDGLKIHKIEDPETLKIWNHVLTKGFDMPDFIADAFLDFGLSLGFDAQMPMRNYLALLNGEPVATSSVFLGAGVAGIYNVTTLPEARRQGIGALITLVPLLEARSSGYRIGVLHSSEMGYKVYRKLGFQEYCRISDYV